MEYFITAFYILVALMVCGCLFVIWHSFRKPVDRSNVEARRRERATEAAWESATGAMPRPRIKRIYPPLRPVRKPEPEVKTQHVDDSPLPFIAAASAFEDSSSIATYGDGMTNSDPTPS